MINNNISLSNICQLISRRWLFLVSSSKLELIHIERRNFLWIFLSKCIWFITTLLFDILNKLLLNIFKIFTSHLRLFDKHVVWLFINYFSCSRFLKLGKLTSSSFWVFISSKENLPVTKNDFINSSHNTSRHSMKFSKIAQLFKLIIKLYVLIFLLISSVLNSSYIKCKWI